MQGSGWDVASDALMVEHLLASTLDPVTHRAAGVSLHPECSGARSDDEVVTVVTLAYDTPATYALPGRIRGLDVVERRLCDELEAWADAPGSVVAIGEAAAAYVVTTSQDDAQSLREHLGELYRRLDPAAGPTPLASAAQGASADLADVTARAVERLVLPRATLPLQDQWTATDVSRRTLWDVVTGARFGTQVRLHAARADGPHAERAEGLLSLSRSPRYTDTAVALHAAVPHAAGPDRDGGPVVWDASAALSGTGQARATLAQALVDHCPPGVWIGVSAWLAGLDDVLQALRTLRGRGHRIVLTAYGSGREPLAAFDELPVDAILLDPHLERGALVDPADRAVHAAIVDHAVRHDVVALTSARHALDAVRRPLPLPAPRHPEPPGQLLERARLVGLTLRETAVLVNATHGQGAVAPRWDRYDVATHWARATS